MKLSHGILAAFGPALLLAPASAYAASDYLLELGGIEGEAKTSIEILSWSWGASNAGSVGSGGLSSGRRTHEPIRSGEPLAADGSVRVLSPRDAASGQATGRRTACTGGKHFPTAVLTSRREAWSLTGVTVSSCDSAGMTLSYRTATKTRSNIQNN